jgi:hypothetical protein
MALRDQPYLPLYIQDIMTDEKLNECCAATHGIFIKGIMCLMHKSEEYGKIVLKQKDQQNANSVRNFAAKIQKHTPYSVEQIEAALFELLAEKVLYIDGDSLCQKRMIEDNIKSEQKKKAGLASAETKKTKSKKSVGTKRATRATTEPATLPENENDIENESKSVAGIDHYGKSENYFHGPVPADLLAYANNLERSSLKSEEWQRKVAADIRSMGYIVSVEAACAYPNEHGEEVEGFVDLRVMNRKIVVCIECDNRITTRDSVVKIHQYGKLVKGYEYAGIVLLRDPKPAVIETDEYKYQYLEKEVEQKMTNALDEIYIDGQRPKWGHIDFDFELNAFREKVRGSPGNYRTHDTGGIRLAFQSQLRNAKKKPNGTNIKGTFGQISPEPGKDYSGGF